MFLGSNDALARVPGHEDKQTRPHITFSNFLDLLVILHSECELCSRSFLECRMMRRSGEIGTGTDAGWCGEGDEIEG
jgi:hypothetical protein